MSAAGIRGLRATYHRLLDKVELMLPEKLRPLYNHPAGKGPGMADRPPLPETCPPSSSKGDFPRPADNSVSRGVTYTPAQPLPPRLFTLLPSTVCRQPSRPLSHPHSLGPLDFVLPHSCDPQAARVAGTPSSSPPSPPERASRGRLWRKGHAASGARRHRPAPGSRPPLPRGLAVPGRPVCDISERAPPAPFLRGRTWVPVPCCRCDLGRSARCQ